MSRTNPLRVGRRVLATLLVLASMAVLALAATPAGANPTNLLGPVPAPSGGGSVSISFSTPVTGLVNGSPITYKVDSASGASLTSIEAHICQHAYGANPDTNRFTSYNNTQFGYGGTDNSTTTANDVRCVYGAGVTTGSLAGASAGYKDGPLGLAPGSLTTGNRTINVGTGTVNWQSTNGIFPTTPLTCDSTNLCDVVFEVGTSGAGAASPRTYFIQPIQFAAVPTAPTALAATAGNAQVVLNWTAPGTGSPFTNYRVNVSPNPSSGPCSTGTCLTGSGSPGYTVTGLTNFTLYSFTVQAINVAGQGPVSNTATATPSLPGPTGLTTAPGDGQVLFSWAAVGGATGYNVTVTGGTFTGSNCPAGICPVVTAPTTSILVTGLANGTTYTFSVSANVPGGTTTASSTTGTPNGALIRQQISVDRPQGVLVISQYCSGSPQDLLGRFDPSNNNGNYVPNAIPNTLCSLTLSGPRPSGLLTDAITSNARTVHDLVTHGTNTVESATMTFVTNDLNQLVTGTGIPAGTRIATIVNAGQVTLTNPVTGSFIGGDLNIVGTTVNFGTIAGNTITPQAHGELLVNNEIEGYQIPGGSHITTLVSGSTVDISAPAMDQSAGLTVRIWTIGPTPAHLIENGPNRGLYFEAQGQLRQVMLVDTRDNDPGWSATGQVSNFCGISGTPGSQCFSGNDLGWTPQGVHAFSRPISTPDGSYTMAPVAGPSVVPGTVALGTGGTTTSADSSAPGTVPGATLASAGQFQGLGLAQLDANLLLWIPRQVKSGHYQATLTLTAI